MRRFYSLLFLSLICCTLNIYAQSVDTETKIFYPDFKTLKIQVADDFLAPPIIHLNSNEQLTITFDEIADDVRYMQYRLIHCNADWQPSQLLDSEIVDGFNIANVNDYAFSSNTFVHYVNYLITIPNQDIKPLVSGNFLLQVFPENDPDDIILQARFCIDEAKVELSNTNLTPKTTRNSRPESSAWATSAESQRQSEIPSRKTTPATTSATSTGTS